MATIAASNEGWRATAEAPPLQPRPPHAPLSPGTRRPGHQLRAGGAESLGEGSPTWLADDAQPQGPSGLAPVAQPMPEKLHSALVEALAPTFGSFKFLEDVPPLLGEDPEMDVSCRTGLEDDGDVDAASIESLRCRALHRLSESVESGALDRAMAEALGRPQLRSSSSVEGCCGQECIHKMRIAELTSEVERLCHENEALRGENLLLRGGGAQGELPASARSAVAAGSGINAIRVAKGGDA